MQDKLRDLVEPIVTGLGLELFDLEYSGATLVVTIERRPVPGRPRREQPESVGIDDITAVTRAVSRALDEADPIAGAYALEVSSPGLERTLRVPAHFAWAVGQKVTVKTLPGFESGRRLRGELVRAGAGPATDDAAPATDDAGRATSIDVVLDDPAGVIVTVPYGQIDKARTVFEWGGEPKPTKPRAAKPKASKATPTKATPSKATPTKATKPAKGDASKATPADTESADASTKATPTDAEPTSSSALDPPAARPADPPAPAAAHPTSPPPAAQTSKKVTAS